MMTIRIVLLCAAIAILPATALAQPDTLDFNFPPPPEEGPADYFTITQDGEARAAIVYPAEYQPEEIRAARSLQQYVELATGATLPLLAEDAAVPEGLARICVGNTTTAPDTSVALPNVAYGEHTFPNINGYLVQTISPDTLIIRGNTPQATMLGAVGFMRRYMGVRRYWPGDPGGVGDVVPQAPTLTVPEVVWQDWPYFISRIMSGLDNRGPQTDASRWSKFQDFWRMNYTIPSNESYYKLLDAANRLDETDLFPLIGGKRFIPSLDERGRVAHGWQPCVSNPRVAEIMAQSVIDAFEADPTRIAMNVAVNDGLGDCTCDACRAMDAPGADIINRIGLCDRYVKLNNKVAEMVAERFPDRILAFLAYGSMRETPQTVSLHPMQLPVLCVWGNAFEMWDKWMATGAEQMGIYLYHDDAWFIMPKLDVHQSAKRLRYIVDSGRARHFYQEFYGIYPLDGMVGYVENELLWDPRIDEDDLLDEHYRLFFRAAEEPMRRFYDALESGYEAWLAEYGFPHPHGMDASSIIDGKNVHQFRVLPPESMAAADEALAHALQAAEGDALVTERVQLVQQIYDFAALGARMYWPMTRLQEAQPASVGDCEAIVEDARAALENGLALSDYKYAVMEHPPISEYTARSASATVYHDLQPGAVPSIVPSAIGGAFGAAGNYLREELGAEAAVAWWRERQAADQPQLLRDLMTVGIFHASGAELVNLVEDASFEERGARAGEAGANGGEEGHELLQGVTFWKSAGTAAEPALTDQEAHSGSYSFTMKNTQRAGVSHAVAASGGDLLLASLWVKHNGAAATYQVDVLPRGEAMLSRTSVAVPEEPNVWHEVKLVFVAPPGTTRVGLYLFTHNQTPDAQVFVDDFFIGRYTAE
ncbi:MAG: DUF4838 domain-containing protein [candidate division WS1 bacterium]|jgi:hypothetical protein|nr:DUF4838 domain-containing protein [candidate division WS1 bacterium]